MSRPKTSPTAMLRPAPLLPLLSLLLASLLLLIQPSRAQDTQPPPSPTNPAPSTQPDQPDQPDHPEQPAPLSEEQQQRALENHQKLYPELKPLASDYPPYGSFDRIPLPKTVTTTLIGLLLMLVVTRFVRSL